MRDLPLELLLYEQKVNFELRKALQIINMDKSKAQVQMFSASCVEISNPFVCPLHFKDYAD